VSATDNPPLRLDEESHLESLGLKIRALRHDQQLTLQAVGERTGLSPSMISMIERAQTSPSVGSLVAIASALGVLVSDLFEFKHTERTDPVTRSAEHAVFETPLGVVHESVIVERPLGLGVNFNTYQVGSASARVLTHHSGFESGVVLEGTLQIELGDESYTLETGDSISYDSSTPHRISNGGDGPARAVWVMLDRENPLGDFAPNQTGLTE
jgi:transcriptional regulator with XRE-family HTH domain